MYTLTIVLLLCKTQFWNFTDKANVFGKKLKQADRVYTFNSKFPLVDHWFSFAFGYGCINEHLLKISLRNHCWKNIFVVAIVIPKMWVCTRNTSIKNDALYLFSFFKFYLLWYKYFSRWKNMNYFSLLLFAFNCFLVIILLYGFLRCWFFSWLWNLWIGIGFMLFFSNCSSFHQKWNSNVDAN